MAELRKKQFIDVFSLHRAEVDWKLLSENFVDMPEYEWRGLLHSIELILRLKFKTKN